MTDREIFRREEREFRRDFATSLNLTLFNGQPIRTLDRSRLRAALAERKRALRPIEPSWPDAAADHDKGGRSLEDHRIMVEFYADRYAAGRDPLTNEEITDSEALANVDKDFTPEPWKDGRWASDNHNGLYSLVNDILGI